MKFWKNLNCVLVWPNVFGFVSLGEFSVRKEKGCTGVGESLGQARSHSLATVWKTIFFFHFLQTPKWLQFFKLFQKRLFCSSFHFAFNQTFVCWPTSARSFTTISALIHCFLLGRDVFHFSSILLLILLFHFWVQKLDLFSQRKKVAFSLSFNCSNFFRIIFFSSLQFDLPMAQLWIRRINFVERLDVSSVPFADNNFMKFVTHHCKNLKALTLWENKAPPLLFLFVLLN